MRIPKVFLPAIFLFLFSCDDFFKCDKGGYDLSDSNLFSFTILDKDTKKNILYIGQTDYFYDTIKILDSDYAKVFPVEGRWSSLDGRSTIYFIDRYKDKMLLINIEENLLFLF
jgi:hypothetical protein